MCWGWDRKELRSAYLVILTRKPSTSPRTLGDRKLAPSVDAGERDSGGMCCRAFLDGDGRLRG